MSRTSYQAGESNSRRFGETVRYFFIIVASFIVLQAVLVIMHEFTHSTTAWALGDMASPWGIVWGNPLTMTGWDEGVDYSRLFAEGRLVQAAFIGVSPLLVHGIMVILGLYFMQKRSVAGRTWLFHIIYWFTVANFMELIAYIFMRPFAQHGDTGIFNRGLGLSPWIFFAVASLALLAGLWKFFRRAVPLANDVLARGNPYTQWTILAMSAFIMFLWGSEIRVMAYVPGPQWMFGLIGIPAFLLVLFLFHPQPTQ